MGWITLGLRRSQLQANVQDLNYELLTLSKERTRLGNFQMALGDGRITPSEIASVGGMLFGEALDFMHSSSAAATEAAELQTNYYQDAFSTITQQQYYDNPSLTGGVNLYFDQETGALNTDMMKQEFYEEALEDYVDTYILPRVVELDKEMEQKQSQLETEIAAQKAELDQIKNSMSQEISSSAIQL